MKARTGLLTVLAASEIAVPTSAQVGGKYAIRGATVHTMAGDAIESATIVISDGRIVAVGANVSVPAGTEVLDATGDPWGIECRADYDAFLRRHREHDSEPAS